MKPSEPEVPSHHVKQQVCATRKAYREGRHAKAVKVYTVNNESRYVLVQGVPSVGATKNLVDLCSQFGPVDDHYALDEYPCEDKYTEVYLFKYKRIQSARFAKKKLDDYSFFGGTLHVCYAPEYESVAETRDKLQDRRRVVAAKIRQHETCQKEASPQAAQTTKLANSDESASLVPQPRSTDLALQAASTTAQRNTSNSLPAVSNAALDNMVPNLQSCPSNVGNHSNHSNSSTGFVVPHPPIPAQINTTTTSIPQPEPFSESRNMPMWQEGTEVSETQQPTFQLPLPPQVSTFIPHSVRGRRRYEFSRTPSAHATLPVGFDARLNVAKHMSLVSSPDITNNSNSNSLSDPEDKVEESPNSINRMVPSGSDNRLVPSGPGVKTVKGKLDTSSVVVKDFKHRGAVPKFVPRQALKRKAADSDPSENHRKTDKLDQDIRKNAFRLGEVQGPGGMSKSSTPSVPPSVEKSVTATIHAIRHKISEVISAKVKPNT